VFSKLLALFIILPLLELYVIIEVGAVLGALPTVLFVVFTAVAGAFLTRLEGLRTLRRMQQQIMVGQMPAEELVNSVLICVAGVLLLTPGFLTDAFGLLVLIPPTRHVLKRWLRYRFNQYMRTRTMETIRFGGL
tara:strand:- start:2695 stop:3096 length:402 start_codon:yes stop_codon:yes gene_type:complete